MSWLENLVLKLGIRVNKQLDDLAEKKEFEVAQDAYIAGDYKTALAGYQFLAESGHGRAAALAGEMHLSGKGTNVNNVKAMKYFQLGTNVGDTDAMALQGMLHASGKPGIKVDYVKARSLLEVAAKAGDAKAKEMLDFVKAKQKR
jgi:TPR repeat protein